ncbi:hypothetical protein LY56_00085 [Roseinatronobacter thiooxidans]|uniref:Uncharacterized protein n=1 Tax=Roseinatronobacter thiooxidans TaxID=121821 RepID=A0A2W7QHB7_9RHOB|nr:hypothetical protein [Roseinatronobacter thiooxidans]PZX47938.1 hypothetical protein LY56_00085 [Roseinatronobacter thiooxidans]
MFDDFSERLFAHFVAGHWRAPLGDETHAVLSHRGTLLGQVVAAGPPDVARAVAVRRGTDRQGCQRLADRVASAAGGLAQAYALQTGRDLDLAHITQMAEQIDAPASARGGLIFTAQETELAAFARALGAGLQGGVIWCPPAGQAVFATAFACLVQQADLPAGAFALLHTRVSATETALRATQLDILAA